MCRFNSLGIACPSLQQEWFDAHRTVAQHCNDIQPGCVIALSDGTVLEPRAANEVTGCECRQWAAWVTLDDGQPGIMDSFGRTFPAAGLGPMGPDGSLALKVLRNSYGPWDVVEPGGSVWNLTPGNASDIQLLGNQQALWIEGGALHLTPNLSILNLPTGTNWSNPRAINIRGVWKLLYASFTRGLVFDGRIIRSTANQLFFGPDIFYDEPSDTYTVAYGNDQALRPDVAFSFTGLQLASFPLVTDPVPEPLPPIDVPIAQPVVLAWFTDGAQNTPGNGDCFVSYHGEPSPNMVVLRTGEVVAQFVAAEADGTLAGLNAAIDAARKAHPGIPVLAYWPQSLQAGPPPNAEIVGVVSYCNAGETPQQLRARLEGVVSRLGRCALICQGYTSNTTLTTDLVPLVNIYYDLAKHHGDIAGLVVFSAGTRATGWDDHPEIHPAWQQVAGLVHPPKVVPPHPEPIPPQPQPTPPPFFPKATVRTKMNVYLKLSGKYIGIDPTPVKGKTGDARFPVYFDRTQGGAWEEVVLTKHDDGHFDALFVASNRTLSISNGTAPFLQSREAGTFGPWEQMFCTDQPDGSSLLYRVDDQGLKPIVLAIEGR